MEAPQVQPQLATIAEPTRFRIVQLLSTRACTVGEVAEHLGALQPQTTKHLQALEAAGVIRVHRLGRRRVARLDRGAMSALSEFFGGLASPAGDDTVLDEYEAAIVREAARPVGDDGARTLEFDRQLAATVSDVWRAWTEPERAVRWWAPQHFEVDSWELDPRPGGAVRFVLREGAGATYASTGVVDEVEPGARLVFRLAPVGADGLPLFAARHAVTLSGSGEATALRLRIDVSDVRAEPDPAVAGLEPGWTQLLDALRLTVES